MIASSVYGRYNLWALLALSPGARGKMTEDVKEVVEEQVVQQEQPQVEVKEEPKEAPKVDQDKNWKQANEVLRLQKQRIEDLEARLTEQTPPPKKEEPDEFSSWDQEDILTVGKARALAEKLAEKKAAEIVRREMDKYTSQQNVAQDEQRARSKYEDYDYVIENYAIPMIKNDPALAHKIQNSKNPAETAYKLGKISDSYEEANMPQKTSPKAEKILKNSQRPVSSSAAVTPLKNQADNFSNMSKEDIWKESQKYARQA